MDFAHGNLKKPKVATKRNTLLDLERDSAETHLSDISSADWVHYLSSKQSCCIKNLTLKPHREIFRRLFGKERRF